MWNIFSLLLGPYLSPPQTPAQSHTLPSRWMVSTWSLCTHKQECDLFCIPEHQQWPTMLKKIMRKYSAIKSISVLIYFTQLHCCLLDPHMIRAMTPENMCHMTPTPPLPPHGHYPMYLKPEPMISQYPIGPATSTSGDMQQTQMLHQLLQHPQGQEWVMTTVGGGTTPWL